MRVVVAPDALAGTLPAAQAARAIAEGWRQRAPDDSLVERPLSDGGPGLLDALAGALARPLHALTVTGPLGGPVPAALLLDGTTAYVEAAQAAGRDLLPTGADDDPLTGERATSRGVGALVAAALDARATRVVVGLGGGTRGLACHDGGAGLLAAVGAVAVPPGALEAGAAGLAELDAVDLAPAQRHVGGVELVAAVDADVPLLGLRGATNVLGVRTGLDADRLVAVDGMLTRLAHAADRAPAGVRGAGAGGGTAYALLLLGATVRRGTDVVAEAVGLDAALDSADLVLTATAELDPRALTDGVVPAVATRAAARGVPCVVLARDLGVGSRELRAGGVDAAYGARQAFGPDALTRPAAALTALAARVARTWSRG